MKEVVVQHPLEAHQEWMDGSEGSKSLVLDKMPPSDRGDGLEHHLQHPTGGSSRTLLASAAAKLDEDVLEVVSRSPPPRPRGGEIDALGSLDAPSPVRRPSATTKQTRAIPSPGAPLRWLHRLDRHWTSLVLCWIGLALFSLAVLLVLPSAEHPQPIDASDALSTCGSASTFRGDARTSGGSDRLYRTAGELSASFRTHDGFSIARGPSGNIAAHCNPDGPALGVHRTAVEIPAKVVCSLIVVLTTVLLPLPAYLYLLGTSWVQSKRARTRMRLRGRGRAPS